MTTLEELIQNVQAWGDEKNITGPHGKATILGQLKKTQEELTETRDEAVIMLNAKHQEAYNEARERFKVELGDQLVTLILLAKLSGVTIAECLSLAHEKIKDRTGVMKDGVFVKDK